MPSKNTKKCQIGLSNKGYQMFFEYGFQYITCLKETKTYKNTTKDTSSYKIE